MLLVVFSFAGSEIKLLSGVEKAIGSMQTNEVAQVVIKGNYITEKFSNQEIVPDDAEIMYEIRLNKFTKVNLPFKLFSFCLQHSVV